MHSRASGSVHSEQSLRLVHEHGREGRGLMEMIAKCRAAFHKRLADTDVVTIDEEGLASIAERSRRTSRIAAHTIADSLNAHVGPKAPDEDVNSHFELAVGQFLSDVAPWSRGPQSASWRVEETRTHRDASLHEANEADESHPVSIGSKDWVYAILDTRSFPGSELLITCSFDERDSVGSNSTDTDLRPEGRSISRDINPSSRSVYAMVSCQLTACRDRSHAARRQAVSLARADKERPHILLVTAEPSPSRITSLALGVGHPDVVYHIALPQLVRGVQASDSDEGLLMLDSLMTKGILRDISDLPVDLSLMEDPFIV